MLFERPRQNEMQQALATRFLTNIWWQHKIRNRKERERERDRECATVAAAPRERGEKTERIEHTTILFDHYQLTRYTKISSHSLCPLCALCRRFLCIFPLHCECVRANRFPMSTMCALLFSSNQFAFPFYIFYGCFVLFNFLFICCRCRYRRCLFMIIFTSLCRSHVQNYGEQHIQAWYLLAYTYYLLPYRHLIRTSLYTHSVRSCETPNEFDSKLDEVNLLEGRNRERARDFGITKRDR